VPARVCHFCGNAVQTTINEQGLEEGTLRILYADGTEAEPLHFCEKCEEKVAAAGKLIAATEGYEWMDMGDLKNPN
jgi:ribosomal protein L24E